MTVQRGTTALPNPNNTQNVAISSVNMDKAMCRILGVTSVSNFGNGIQQTLCKVRLTSATNIEVTREAGYSSDTMNVSWEVVDFS